MSKTQVFDVLFTIQEDGKMLDRGRLVLHAADKEHAERKAREAIWAGLQRMHIPFERVTVGIHEAKIVA